MEEAGETRPKQEEGSVINVVVKDQSGAEIHFKIKPHTKLCKVMDAYCSKKSVDAGSVRFLFDGVRVDRNATASDLGLENDDTIDCVIEQVGGSC